MAEVPQERVAVTIVGGGPIGLTMGLLLGRFGIPAVILERNTTTTDHRLMPPMVLSMAQMSRRSQE